MARAGRRAGRRRRLRPSCSSAASAGAARLGEDRWRRRTAASAAVPRLRRQPRILARRHLGKQRGDLEGARQPEPADLVAGQSGDRAGRRSGSRPRVGLTVPVMTLNSVVLPAPLGPMTARTSPSSTCMATWSTRDQRAVAPRHAVESRAAAIAHGASRPGGCGRRPHAPIAVASPQMPCGREQDEGDEDQAEDRAPRPRSRS